MLESAFGVFVWMIRINLIDQYSVRVGNVCVFAFGVVEVDFCDLIGNLCLCHRIQIRQCLFPSNNITCSSCMRARDEYSAKPDEKMHIKIPKIGIIRL